MSSLQSMANKDRESVINKKRRPDAGRLVYTNFRLLNSSCSGSRLFFKSISSARWATCATASAVSSPTTATSATSAVRFRARLVDLDAATLDFSSVEAGYGSSGLIIIRHLDKPESTGPSRVAVGDDFHGLDVAEWLEEGSDFLFTGLVTHVTYKDVHKCSTISLRKVADVPNRMPVSTRHLQNKTGRPISQVKAGDFRLKIHMLDVWKSGVSSPNLLLLLIIFTRQNLFITKFFRSASLWLAGPQTSRRQLDPGCRVKLSNISHKFFRSASLWLAGPQTSRRQLDPGCRVKLINISYSLERSRKIQRQAQGCR